MKKLLFLALFIIVVIICYNLTNFFRNKTLTQVSMVHDAVQRDIEQLQHWYDHQWTPAIESGKEMQLKKAFLEGRARYKKLEWAVEYFFPQTAKELNGPPLAEVEAEEHIEIPPSGLQVIEEFIYPHYDPATQPQLLSESRKLASVCYRLQTLWKEHQFRDDQVWSAMRLQLMRILALGTSGFDTPLSLAGITEIKPSLSSIKEVVGFYKKRTSSNVMIAIDNKIEDAIAFAENNNDFTSFDRMQFTVRHIGPLANKMLYVQKALQLPVEDHGALNVNTSSFLDSNAFNAGFFIPNALSGISKEKVELGKKLFFSPILSLNNNVSCATCHQPSKAFTDGLARSRSADGSQFVKRNAPTLLYAGLQQKQFYDMRASYLEDQVKNVIENKDEMHGSLPIAAQRLTNDPSYLQMFRTAFSANIDTVSEVQVQIAIASYIRSLNPFSSKFDRHLRGHKSMSTEEIEGFNLFMGKAKCGTCHFMPLFNGTVPPMYQTTESEVIGVPSDKQFTSVSKDRGRYDIHPVPKFLNAFKTPTVRNVQLTAPYMHNGVYNTLEEVIDFYDHGGAGGRGVVLDNQTLPSDSLHLTEREKRNLILFLNTLSEEGE